MLDLAHMIAAFSMFMHIVTIAAVLLVQTNDQPALPSDVIQRMVLDTVCVCNLAPLTAKMLSFYLSQTKE
jgi:hypothetical protein